MRIIPIVQHKYIRGPFPLYNILHTKEDHSLAQHITYTGGPFPF